MASIPQEMYKNDPESIHKYHQLSAQLEDSLKDLEIHSAVLTDDQMLRIKDLSDEIVGKQSFTVSEVDRQYHLLLKIQRQVLEGAGDIRGTASIRDQASMVSTLGSVLTLFLKAQKEIDKIKEEANLKDAVMVALDGLPESHKKRFFVRLEKLSK